MKDICISSRTLATSFLPDIGIIDRRPSPTPATCRRATDMITEEAVARGGATPPGAMPMPVWTMPATAAPTTPAIAAPTTSTRIAPGEGAWIVRLYEMVAAEDAVRWTPNGRAFTIIDAHAFIKACPPEVSKGGNFTSFKRRIQQYGFERVTRELALASFGVQGSEVWVHKNFTRDDRGSLRWIKPERHTSKYKAGDAARDRLDQMAAELEEDEPGLAADKETCRAAAARLEAARAKRKAVHEEIKQFKAKKAMHEGTFKARMRMPLAAVESQASRGPPRRLEYGSPLAVPVAEDVSANEESTQG